MSFWRIFFGLLSRRPRAALAALYWQVTRRRVRARNRLLTASAELPFAYKIWIRDRERAATVARDAPDTMRTWAHQPRFSILLYSDGSFDSDDCQRSIASVESQAYDNWDIDRSTDRLLVDRIASATGDFVVFLRVGDLLARTALYRLSESLQDEPRAAILFGDHDEVDLKGDRRRPWFKPEWNEELFLALDYLSPAFAIAASVARKSTSKDPSSLLIDAAMRAQGKILRVPHILVHSKNLSLESDFVARAARLSAHLSPQGARINAGPFDTIKVNWPLPTEQPLVSIIIPTKDKADLLRACVESVLAKTEYGNFEILVIDNGSTEGEAIDYLEELSGRAKVRVLAYPEPYNFSAINNFAAAQARGDFICLLNNDTEVLEPAWLTEMIRHACRSHIGAVGAKLLYEDGSIQHAGVVIGIGEAAGHAHRFVPASSSGYFNMPHVTHYVSAVTAACLVVEKAKFMAVGGLDEVSLPVAFNDVDFCLKLEQHGWRNIYVPHAVLLHHESRSRGSDMAPSQVERYRRELTVLQERWKTKTYSDPLHNPNLSRQSETFVFWL